MVLYAASPGPAGSTFPPPVPKFSENVAFDVSAPLRDMKSASAPRFEAPAEDEDVIEIRPERDVVRQTNGYSVDGALQRTLGPQGPGPLIPSPLVTFEGLSNQDNFNIFGFRVNPPDPVGDVGPNHYVEMINLGFGIYSKTGTLLLGPIDIGTLWSGFAIPDCTDPSGDPIVRLRSIDGPLASLAVHDRRTRVTF